MVISYFGEGSKIEYKLNNLRTKELEKDKILIITDYGSWCVLNKKEYDELKSEKLEPNGELFKVAEEKGLIITKDNETKVIEDYRKKCGFLFQGASLHIVVPTSRCNQQCLYCHASAKTENSTGNDMDKETAEKVVDFILQSPSPIIKIEFQGGEPLLNLDIIKCIIDYSKRANKNFNKTLEFAISTNLTLMTNEILDYLKENKVSISTSLDGPKELHDKNRPFGGASSYDLVTKWIKQYDKIEAIPVITKNSLSYSKELLDEYIKKGLNLVWIKPIHKIGNALKTWDKIGYGAEEFLDFWEKSLDYIIKLNKEGKKVKDVFTTIILKKILKKEGINFCDLQSPCGAAISQLAYNEKGDIYICDESRQNEIFKLGNVKEDNHKKIMSSRKTLDIIASSVNETLMCDACTWKPYCGVCPVVSYTSQGTIIPKLPMLDRCKIYKGAFEHIFNKILSEKEVKDIFLNWIKADGSF